jgi:hypothetical protein
MATTTNYSWSTPDDTALVKDGAAAIRSLGTAIDSTVFTNAGAAINKSLVDAAGDLIYGTADNTVARLAIGTANQVLKVNSGATAPEWGTAPSGGMTLLNTGGTTLTGASVTISSIPATYNDLKIIVRNFRPATDGSACQVRINGDGASSRHKTTNTVSEDSSNFNSEAINISRSSDNGTSNSLIAATIYDYANTTTWKILQTHAAITPNSTTPANINTVFNHGYYNQTTAISSLEFRCDAGNFTSGTVFVYGVK